MKIVRNIIPEKVFCEHIEKLIKNLLIENPNYSNGYYNDNYTILEDTKERANYILREIERTKHLIDL